MNTSDIVNFQKDVVKMNGTSSTLREKGVFPRPEDFELVEMVNQVPWRLVPKEVWSICFSVGSFSKIVS